MREIRQRRFSPAVRRALEPEESEPSGPSPRYDPAVPIGDGSELARTNVLGVGISALNMRSTLEWIGDAVARRRRGYVCVCPVMSVMTSHSNPELRAAINQASLATPDGMPLVWLSRAAGHSHVERVYGPDLMLAAFDESERTGWRHFLFGGSDGVTHTLKTRLSARFPKAVIAGAHEPPFGNVEELASDEVADRINTARPDIVWVGIGAPKQELWMARVRERLEAPVLIGVGAAFDFHSGRVRQAPRWMQRRGLEWFFRLAQDPRRLWHRYLVLNTLFLIKLAGQRTGILRYSLEASAGSGTRRRA